MGLESLSPKTLTLILGSSLTVLALLRLASSSPPESKIIPSPRDTVLPRLSKQERDELPYPPDVMPGARDVHSPYGTIRVYEWGPPSGRKIMLIHGISTPSPALRGLANHLVALGCRVMLFDLFGRGYSDSPDLPHDRRLWTTQILLAVNSSAISWTTEGFSMIGYSLGGGISADFAADFPDSVKGLVLLAPAGLIRSSHFGKTSRFMYSGFLPEAWLRWVVKQRLGVGSVSPVQESGDEENPTTSEELKGNRDPKFDAVLLRPGVSIGMATQWQLKNHEGYIRSFISTIRYASIEGAGETWKKLGVRKERVMVIAGSEDAIIIADELREDAISYTGENLEFRIMSGGHEFPISNAEEVAGMIADFWKLSAKDESDI